MLADRRLIRSITLASLAAVALSACGSEADTLAGPGAVSEGEARALDEAAKMLDEKRLPEGALPDVDPPAPGARTDASPTTTD